MNLEDFKNELAREAHGMTPTEAQQKGLCINCKEPALPKCYSEAGIREYSISGTCEKCFDEMFADDDEEEV